MRLCADGDGWKVRGDFVEASIGEDRVQVIENGVDASDWLNMPMVTARKRAGDTDGSTKNRAGDARRRWNATIS